MYVYVLVRSVYKGVAMTSTPRRCCAWPGPRGGDVGGQLLDELALRRVHRARRLLEHLMELEEVGASQRLGLGTAAE